MTKIIKGNKKFEIGNGEISNIDCVYDGIFIRCVDQTEIKFSFSTPKGLSSIIDIANRNIGKDMTINLNEASIGNLSKVLILGKIL